jgi:hypothetical protein
VSRTATIDAYPAFLSSHTNHDVAGLVPAGMFPENSLPRAVLDALSSFGCNLSLFASYVVYTHRYLLGEAYQPIYNSQYVINGTQPEKIYKLRIEGQPSCGNLSSDQCVQERPNIGRTLYNAIGQVDLSVIDNPSLVEADIGTVLNLLEIFYAALRIDFGHWTPNNVGESLYFLYRFGSLTLLAAYIWPLALHEYHGIQRFD